MHVTVMGQGPDLVMLHGWSMHSGVWHTFADSLSDYFTLHLVDLPGHGQSEWEQDAFELDNVLARCAEILPARAIVLGWSLGGLIGLAYAQRHPTRVQQLCLLAASPCFVQRADWPRAMETGIFSQFAQQLATDQAATLQQFLLLQARGSAHSRQTIKALSEKMNEVGVANTVALQAGLELLISLDMRAALSELRCPTLLLLGERDTLIPVNMVEHAALLNPDLQTVVLPGAGHAPFISHQEACEQAILAWTGIDHD